MQLEARTLLPITDQRSRMAPLCDRTCRPVRGLWNLCVCFLQKFRSCRASVPGHPAIHQNSDEISFARRENRIEPSRSGRVFVVANGRLFPEDCRCSRAKQQALSPGGKNGSQKPPTFSLSLAGGIENPDRSIRSISYCHIWTQVPCKTFNLIAESTSLLWGACRFLNFLDNFVSAVGA